MGDTKEGNKISCHCGKCSFSLNQRKAVRSLLCGCEDCRQALEWGSTLGGKKPTGIERAVYVKSEISTVSGKESMRVVMLRENAKSTRIHCENCGAIIGIDHIGYSDNVFMFFPRHCSTDCDVSISPSAAIYLDDASEDAIASIPEEIPKIFNHSKNPEEKKLLYSLGPHKETFSPPKTAAKGKTIREVISSIGNVEILNLEKGATIV